MKITKKNIESIRNSSDGYIGTIVEKRFTQPNLLNFCTKSGDNVEVEAKEDRVPTIHTIKEFVSIYSGKNLIIL